MYRNFLVLCCVAFVVGCAVCQATADDEAAPTFVYVCRDAGAGGYQAFPDVCRLHDGRLMCVFYASYHHIGLPKPEWPKGGRIAYFISTDEGHSWSEPATLFDGPDDDRDPSIVQLKSGRILCNFFSLHRNAEPTEPCANPFAEPYTSLGTWIVASDDFGKTWSKPEQVYDAYYCSSPIRELSDGRLVMPLYREIADSAAAAVGISDDGGRTWAKPVDIDNAGHRLDAETDVIELADGRLWAAERASHEPICQAVSADRGNTWSKSQPLDFVGHSPYLLRVAGSNTILLGYRGYKTLDGSGPGFTAMRYSMDECETWSDPIVIDTLVGAYPSMVNLKDGSVLVVYYEEGGQSSIRARRFRATADGIEWLAP